MTSREAFEIPVSIEVFDALELGRWLQESESRRHLLAEVRRIDASFMGWPNWRHVFRGGGE